jgi:hypothetical protein
MDAAVRGDGGSDCFLQLRRISHVGRMHGGLAAGLCDLAGDAISNVLLLAINNRDVGAGLAKEFSHALADAAAAAEHQHRALGEFTRLHLALRKFCFLISPIIRSAQRRSLIRWDDSGHAALRLLRMAVVERHPHATRGFRAAKWARERKEGCQRALRRSRAGCLPHPLPAAGTVSAPARPLWEKKVVIFYISSLILINI